MGDIYCRAAGVIIWLGSGSPNRKHALHLLQMNNNRRHRVPPHTDRHLSYDLHSANACAHAPLNSALASLSSDGYWSRQWIIQKGQGQRCSGSCTVRSKFRGSDGEPYITQSIAILVLCTTSDCNKVKVGL